MTHFIQNLRGIVMKAPSIRQTHSFYENEWGLGLAFEDRETTYLHGTGQEPFIYALKDSATYGIEAIHFGIKNREETHALYDSLSQKIPDVVLGKPSSFQDITGGYGFEILDPENRKLRLSTDVKMRQSIQDQFAHPRKLSHVVLNSADMDHVQNFYVQTLGFRVSDYSADQMVFLRCHTDHHSIALSRASYPSINHVAFEMPDIDSFMRGIGRMKQAGHLPSWGPGRHGPGNNPFAYFVSPSGFVIEFTAELQQIDEATHQVQVWTRDDPAKMDLWLTAGPPTVAQRTVMQGQPDYGFPELRKK